MDAHLRLLDQISTNFGSKLHSLIERELGGKKSNMWRLIRSVARISAAMILILVSAQITRADEYDLLFMEFDARGMSEVEKRYLQAGLALEGHYRGLIDGAWGRRSQSSLEAYVAREFPDADPSHPLFIHALGPLMTVFRYVDELGWHDRYFEDSGIALAAPWGILRPVTGEENHWATDDDRLDLRYIVAPAWKVAELHSNVLTHHKAQDDPYLVRRSDRMVTSVQLANGGGAFLR
jgi:hypothetical protein